MALNNHLFHVVCFTCSLLVFLFVATSVETTILAWWLCLNAIVSATWHAWRWATELEAELAYRTAPNMLKLDVGGAVAGAAIVFTTHPPSRAPLAMSGALAASSMLQSRLVPDTGSRNKMPWFHIGAHVIFVALAAAHAIAIAAEVEDSYDHDEDFICFSWLNDPDEDAPKD